MRGKSGKSLAIYISPLRVHVLEGVVKGDTRISRTFTVEGVSTFFAPPPSKEITNMSGLVKAIVDECKAQAVTTKKVLICLPFGITTEFNQTEGGVSLREMLSQDYRNDKAKKKKKDSTKAKVSPDKMTSKVNWGGYFKDGAVYQVSSVSTGDKYMLSSLVKEFYKYGYTVAGITDVIGALIPFRQTDQAGFDSQGKIMIDCDYQVTVVTMYRDVPIRCDSIPAIEKSDLAERLSALVSERIHTTGKNPKVYLSGDVFKDKTFYLSVMERLNDYCEVVDVFGLSDVTQGHIGEGSKEQPMDEEQVTPNYGVSIGMLMAQATKNTFLSPGVTLGAIAEKNSKDICRVAVFLSAAVLTIAVVTAGMRAFQLFEMNRNPSQTVSLQSQINSLTAKQTSMSNTIQILSQTDSTVLNILDFIQDNDSDRVKVVSVDTAEMLVTDPAGATPVNNSFAISGSATGSDAGTGSDASPTPPSSSSGSTSVGSDAPPTSAPTGGSSDAPVSNIISGSSGTITTREPIIIRGYSKTGFEAVNYFQKLFNSGLVVDPVLNGVERQILPNGQEVYIFEIQIGG